MRKFHLIFCILLLLLLLFWPFVKLATNFCCFFTQGTTMKCQETATDHDYFLFTGIKHSKLLKIINAVIIGLIICLYFRFYCKINVIFKIEIAIKTFFYLNLVFIN